MFLKNLSNIHCEPTPLTDFLCLGSSEENHVKIKDAAASEKHARIEKKEDLYIIRDLRSTHGTFVNGIRVLETFIDLGDIIRIGEQEFIVDNDVVHSLPELVSYNKSWNETLLKIPKLAKTDLPILILGPSGSGKELLAQQIHNHSTRKSCPIIRVNCSALTESLVESELFGHMRGSFTGATQDRKGAFEAARTGTLVLDEVGDLPLCLQPKLLRALENKEIKPVGSDKIIKTNVRIIASTHQDLKAKVEKGEFRQDLYYRLNVLQLQVPALIERMEDFEKILFEFAKEMKVKFSFAAIQELYKHNWPGNIRELKNTVSRALMCMQGAKIEVDDVRKLMDRPISIPNQIVPEIKLNRATNSSVIKEIEKQMIQKRLIANGGNQRKTAEDLGMPRSTLNDKIKSYEINIDTLVYRSFYPLTTKNIC